VKITDNFKEGFPVELQVFDEKPTLKNIVEPKERKYDTQRSETELSQLRILTALIAEGLKGGVNPNNIFPDYIAKQTFYDNIQELTKENKEEGGRPFVEKRKVGKNKKSKKEKLFITEEGLRFYRENYPELYELASWRNKQIDQLNQSKSYLLDILKNESGARSRSKKEGRVDSVIGIDQIIVGGREVGIVAVEIFPAKDGGKATASLKELRKLLKRIRTRVTMSREGKQIRRKGVLEQMDRILINYLTYKFLIDRKFTPDAFSELYNFRVIYSYIWDGPAYLQVILNKSKELGYQLRNK